MVYSVVVMQLYLGGSYGLKKIAGTSLTEKDFRGGKIVQQFIPGFDVTVPIFTDAASGDTVVGDATVYSPSDADPTSWVYDHDAKDAYVGGQEVTSVVRQQLPLSECARDNVLDVCAEIGVDCFARFDFRMRLDSLDGLSSVTGDCLYFID